MDKKKAAFIKYGRFSHINDSVLAELRRNFPDFEFDVFDMMPHKYSISIGLALLHCLKEYGPDIISGRKKFMGTYNRTSWFFNKNRKYLLKTLSGKDYKFTFQTQSLFDASLPGIPHFLYTDHTHLENLNYPGWNRDLLLNRQWLSLEESIYKNATLNFTMSSNISRSLIDDYNCDPGKVKCIYCGSNVKIEKNEKFDESRFTKKNVLFVGVDWNRKGGSVLLDAFKLVLKAHPDATLTIVGSSPEIEVPNCKILGRVSLGEVKKCYNEASVFCLPSLLEPFGIVFLEAMAHKLPVVATKIGAIPDFIHEGKNGYLVSPKDPVELSKALIRMLDSPEECKTFGEYGSNLFWDRYTWEKTGLKLHDHIRKFVQ